LKRLEKLASIMRSRKYFLVFIVSFGVLAPILAVTSNILVLPTFEFNPIAEPAKIGLVAVIGLLMSLNIAALLHRVDGHNSALNKTGFAGALVGLFTSTCSVCQPIWLFWLGFGSASAFLADISFYIGTASIMLLGFSLYQLLGDETCGVKVNGKNN